MDRISSVDDIVSTYWNESCASLGKSGMNRSASEFAFQEFLKESVGGGRPKSRFQQAQSGEGRDVEEVPVPKAGNSEFIPPMFASTEELRAMNNVVDAVEEDEVAVQLEGAFNPLFSDMQDDGEKNYTNFASGAAAGVVDSSQEYEFLKHKLEIACAAASLSMVRTSSVSTLRINLCSTSSKALQS